MAGGNFELRHWLQQPCPKSIVIPDSLHLNPLATPSPPSASRGNGYTSLSELINSPTTNGAVNSPTSSSLEIRIRNRLVKQAAYAYLQPTPSLTDASRRRRFSLRRALRLFGSCFGFVGLFLRKIRIRRATALES